MVVAKLSGGEIDERLMIILMIVEVEVDGEQGGSSGHLSYLGWHMIWRLSDNLISRYFFFQVKIDNGFSAARIFGVRLDL
jgi:hypothetical protein